MLKITRNRGEGLVIGDDVRVYYLGTKDGALKIGVQAPKHISVDRLELRQRKERQKANEEPDSGQGS